jgi:leucyl-tRNA synthetase
MTQDEEFTLVMQVNGKVRERIEVPASISEEEVKQITLSNERVLSFVGDVSKVVKVIYIPGRLVNIVIRK